MSVKHSEEYRDPRIAERLLARIRASSTTPVRLMEVCGTHTVSIFRHGLRTILPPSITLVSGPGCPVCVTDQGEIDAFVALARQEGVIVATFGDLMRVPGSHSSLQKERAAGRDVRLVYSALDALQIARRNPSHKVAFLGVGFETTAPTIAASILAARQEGLTNYLVFSAHKRVPPALEALMQTPAAGIDGFLLPGHVSVIIGVQAYRPFFDRHGIPCAVAGFEPGDILQAVALLTEQIAAGRPRLDNCYPRAVSEEGNPRARGVMEAVFQVADARWRGIGIIPRSGLAIREGFAAFDARRQLQIDVSETQEPAGCACGDILAGVKVPPQCALYGKTCTPADPVGPCMVSGEGTCAAYHRYHREETPPP
jgi:hydrogenase expression/formation protein HypD